MNLTKKDIGKWIYRDGGLFPAVLRKVHGNRLKMIFVDGSGGSYWEEGLDKYRLATKKEVLKELRNYTEEVRGWN